MITNEFILMDRVQKIKQIINQYGEENFYLSFSGGKDSTVLSALVDLAIPDNKIPRVFANTGIELDIIRDFVFKLKEIDERIQIIAPTKNIKKTLYEFGYLFKSKDHSGKVSIFQNSGFSKNVDRYLNPPLERKRFGCPLNINLQKELDVLEKYFPAERKQCEIIWKPVYDEYRRLGYRLKNNNYEQVELEDYLKGLEMEE